MFRLDLPPGARGLTEILRRLLCLALLLGAAWALLMPAPRLLRVSLPDLRAAYQRDAALLGKDAAGFEAWKREKLDGRVLTVQGAFWSRAHATLAGADSLPGKPLRDNLGRDGGVLWFAENDARLRGLDLPGEAFRYLLLQGAPEAPPLGASFVESRHARGAPDRLLHPLRALAPWLFLAALAAYLLPPGPTRRENAARYSRVRAVVLPDMAGLGLALFFFSLPLLIVSSTAGPQELLAFDRGWGVLTLLFWGMALLGVWLTALAARYACFEAVADGQGISLRTLWSARKLDYADVAEVRAYDGEARARLLSRLLLVFGGGMPQAMGMALLVRGNVERGLELGLKDGGRVRVMFNALHGADRLLDALAGAGFPVPALLRRLAADL